MQEALPQPVHRCCERSEERRRKGEHTDKERSQNAERETKTMIPDLQSSLLCDDVRQERNGKFILIGLFDAVGVAKFPAVFQRICVVNRWCCGEGEFHQRSRIIKPDGNTTLVEGKDVRVKLPDSEAAATSVEFFMNVKFETEGTYWVEILLDGDLKVRYPLKAKKVQTQRDNKHPELPSPELPSN
jgi:hypothetical protein